MASSKFVAQYASNQLKCVACGEPICANSLILGLVDKNSVGFEETWHHWFCIPITSVPIDSVEGVDGFYSLKMFDQDRLKDFLTSGEKVVLKEDEVAGDELEGSNPKKPKIDELTANELEGSNSEKPKGNRRSAGFNIEERQSYETNFLSKGFVDTFRRQHPDVLGYTYWGYKHGWHGYIIIADD